MIGHHMADNALKMADNALKKHYLQENNNKNQSYDYPKSK